MTTIYADNAATTEMSPAALDAMTAALHDNYANAASRHRMGQRAAAAGQTVVFYDGDIVVGGGTIR